MQMLLSGPCLYFLRVHLFGHLLFPHLCYSPGPFLLFGPCKALTRQQVIKVGIRGPGLRTWRREIQTKREKIIIQYDEIISFNSYGKLFPM